MTPELVMAMKGFFVTGLVLAITAVMNRYTLKLPATRKNGNGNQFSGMSISEIEDRCRKFHAPIDTRLLDIDKVNAQQASDIRHIENELERGDKKFEAIQLDIRTILTKQGALGAKFEAREKALTDTITDATQIMRELLIKSG